MHYVTEPQVPPEQTAPQTVAPTESVNANLMTGFGGGRASLNSPEPSMGTEAMSRIASNVSQLNTLFPNTQYSSVAGSYQAMDSMVNSTLNINSGPVNTLQTASTPVSDTSTNAMLQTPPDPVGSLMLHSDAKPVNAS